MIQQDSASRHDEPIASKLNNIIAKRFIHIELTSQHHESV